MFILLSFSVHSNFNLVYNMTFESESISDFVTSGAGISITTSNCRIGSCLYFGDNNGQTVEYAFINNNTFNISNDKEFKIRGWYRDFDTSPSTGVGIRYSSNQWYTFNIHHVSGLTMRQTRFFDEASYGALTLNTTSNAGNYGNTWVYCVTHYKNFSYIYNFTCWSDSSKSTLIMKTSNYTDTYARDNYGSNVQALFFGAQKQYEFDDIELLVFSSVSPSLTIDNSTYNVTSAYSNNTIWRTNGSLSVLSLDASPTVSFSTSINSNCSIGLVSENYSSSILRNPDTECSTTETTTHSCTLPTSENLSYGVSNIYISCYDGSNYYNSNGKSIKLLYKANISSVTPSNSSTSSYGNVSISWLSLNKDLDDYNHYLYLSDNLSLVNSFDSSVLVYSVVGSNGSTFSYVYNSTNGTTVYWAIKTNDTLFSNNTGTYNYNVNSLSLYLGDEYNQQPQTIVMSGSGLYSLNFNYYIALDNLNLINDSFVYSKKLLNNSLINSITLINTGTDVSSYSFDTENLTLNASPVYPDDGLCNEYNISFSSIVLNVTDFNSSCDDGLSGVCSFKIRIKNLKKFKANSLNFKINSSLLSNWDYRTSADISYSSKTTNQYNNTYTGIRANSALCQDTFTTNANTGEGSNSDFSGSVSDANTTINPSVTTDSTGVELLGFNNGGDFELKLTYNFNIESSNNGLDGSFSNSAGGGGGAPNTIIIGNISIYPNNIDQSFFILPFSSKEPKTKIFVDQEINGCVFEFPNSNLSCEIKDNFVYVIYNHDRTKLSEFIQNKLIITTSRGKAIIPFTFRTFNEISIIILISFILLIFGGFIYVK